MAPLLCCGVDSTGGAIVAKEEGRPMIRAARSGDVKRRFRLTTKVQARLSILLVVQRIHKVQQLSTSFLGQAKAAQLCL